MWAVDTSGHSIDVPSEGLRDKCDSHSQGNPHLLLLLLLFIPPLLLCVGAFLASQIHTVEPHFSKA